MRKEQAEEGRGMQVEYRLSYLDGAYHFALQPAEVH